MAFRRDLANLTINLDMNSAQLVQKSQESARYLGSLKNASGRTTQGFGLLQGKMNNVASAMASLGVPQPLMAMNALSTAANSLIPVFDPIIKGVGDFSKNLKTIDIKPMTTSLSDGFSSMLNTVKRISAEIINTILSMIGRITGMNIPLIGATGNVGGGALQGFTQAGVAGLVAGKSATIDVEKLLKNNALISGVNTVTKKMGDELNKLLATRVKYIDIDLKKSVKATSDVFGQNEMGRYLGHPKGAPKIMSKAYPYIEGLNPLQRIMGARNQFDSWGDFFKNLISNYYPKTTKALINIGGLFGKLRQTLKFVGSSFASVGSEIANFSLAILSAVGSIGALITSTAGLATLGVGGLGVGGLGILSKIIVSTTKHMDALAKSAKALQMPSQSLLVLKDFGDYSGWREGADQFIIRMMDRASIDASLGSKQKIDAFKLLGIDINESMSKYDKFFSIMSGLERLSPRLQMQSAMEIFGPRNAGMVIQALDGWRDTLDRVYKNRDVSPYADLSAVEKLQDRATDLQKRWDSFKDRMKLALLPFAEVGIWLFEGFVKVLQTIVKIMKFGATLGAKVFAGSKEEANKFKEELDKISNSLSDIGNEEAISEMTAKLEKITSAIKSPIEDFKEDFRDLQAFLKQGSISQSQYNEYLEKTVNAMFDIQDPIKKYRSELEKIDELQRMGVITHEQTQKALENIKKPYEEAGNAIRDGMLSPLEKVKKELRELNETARGITVDGVKVGGLNQEEYLAATRWKTKEFISGISKDFDGLLKQLSENSDLFKHHAWIDSMQELIDETFTQLNPLDDFIDKMKNINNAFEDGYLNMDMYTKSIEDLVTGFQPATDKLDEISAKLIEMSKLGKVFGTEGLLDLTSGLKPIERISAIMDGYMLGGLDPRSTFSAINTMFGQLQDEVFQLEEALSLGQINPMLFQEKLSPLLEGLREAEWIASSIFGSMLDPGAQWWNKFNQQIEHQREQFQKYQEEMEEMMENMAPPAYQGPGAFTSVEWGDAGGGLESAGVASATQIAGIMATAQALSQRPAEKTASNTGKIVERMDNLITLQERNHGGLW